MKPKIKTRITNLIAKLAGSPDYEPGVQPKEPIEFYLEDAIDGILDGSIGVTPASIVTATGQMTDAQKASTRNNIKAVATHDGKADNLNIVLDSSQANSSGVYLTGRYLDGALSDVPELALAGTEGDERVLVSRVADPLGSYDAANKQYVDSRTFIITVTYDDVNDKYTADKSFAEIWDAYQDGKICIAYYGSDMYIFSAVYDDRPKTIDFVCVRYLAQEDMSKVSFFRLIGSSAVWRKHDYIIQIATATVIDLSSTSITLAPQTNTEYHYGELTSLAITNPPATGAYSIVFTSGSTATNIPAQLNILGLENFEPEVNTLYEINVLDNRAAIGSWAVR